MVKQSLLASHRVSPDEMTEMTEKIGSITKRIRDLELRLLNKKLLYGSFREWNALTELSIQLNIRSEMVPLETQYYVVLPTKECVDILNKLAVANSVVDTMVYLNKLSDMSKP